MTIILEKEDNEVVSLAGNLSTQNSFQGEGMLALFTSDDAASLYRLNVWLLYNNLNKTSQFVTKWGLINENSDKSLRVKVIKCNSLCCLIYRFMLVFPYNITVYF